MRSPSIARLLDREGAAHHANEGSEASISIVLAEIDGITHDVATSRRDPSKDVRSRRTAEWQADVADDDTLVGVDEALPVVRMLEPICCHRHRRNS